MISKNYVTELMTKWTKLFYMYATVYIVDIFFRIVAYLGNIYNDKYNFIRIYLSVLKLSNTKKGNPSYIVNHIIRFSQHVTETLYDACREDLTEDFYCAIQGDFTYAGSLTSNDLRLLQQKAKNNELDQTHLRYAYNVLWALIGKVICPLIFQGCVSGGLYHKNEKISMDIIKHNIENGIDHMICILNLINVNKEILLVVMKDNLRALEAILEKHNFQKEMSCSDMYNHIIKMIYIGSRPIQVRDRDIYKPGYNEEYMKRVGFLSEYFLCENEKELAKFHKKEFPWGKRDIYGISSTSSYYKMCQRNGLYIGSGRSGSTFELLIMLIVLFPDIFKKVDDVRKILMFFVNFHMLTGTHSVLECLLSFSDVIKYMDDVCKEFGYNNEGLNNLNNIFSEFYLGGSKGYFQINKVHMLNDMLSGKVTVKDSIIINLKTMDSVYVDTDKY